MKRKVIIALVVVALGIQLVPVDRTNPPVLNDLHAPAEVKEILVRSCYDCHSNTTRWPWYAKIAPVSWLVSHDVDDGREELNFSDWRAYDARRQTHLATEILESIEKREMPMPIYIFLHGEAKLTGSEIGTLRAWRP
ncbi:MAG: heme-binding domain-containing protein [bacterium]|nr:heme-binding domain-containing protein [bacterium]